jgi:hypothetical protein
MIIVVPTFFLQGKSNEHLNSNDEKGLEEFTTLVKIELVSKLTVVSITLAMYISQFVGSKNLTFPEISRKDFMIKVFLSIINNLLCS